MQKLLLETFEKIELASIILVVCLIGSISLQIKSSVFGAVLVFWVLLSATPKSSWSNATALVYTLAVILHLLSWFNLLGWDYEKRIVVFLIGISIWITGISFSLLREGYRIQIKKEKGS